MLACCHDLWLNMVAAATGIKFSLNDVIIKAAALTLRAVPTVNSIWSGSSASIQNNVDISIAVATDSGLITPIVSGPDHKSVYDISSTFKVACSDLHHHTLMSQELVGRAREGKLAPHEYQGGTFRLPFCCWFFEITGSLTRQYFEFGNVRHF